MDYSNNNKYESQTPNNNKDDSKYGDTDVFWCGRESVWLIGSVRSEVSDRTCPKQNLSQQLNMIIMIDLADACADMSALADTSAARTTARMMTCTSAWPCLPSNVTSSEWCNVYHYYVNVQVN